MPETTFRAVDRSQRRCPGCGQVKKWSPADGGADFYTRQRRRREVAKNGVIKFVEEMIASPYCRSCTSGRNAEGRRKKALVGKLARVTESAQPPQLPLVSWSGNCEVCGEVVRQVAVADTPRVVFACWRCALLVKEGHNRLVAMLGLTYGHNEREQQLADEVVDRGPGRGVHVGNKFGGITDHGDCLRLEERVKAVLLWKIRP